MNSITVQRGDLKRQFLYRPKTSDEKVINQIFRAQHYSLQGLARFAEISSFLESMHRAGRRPFIVDAGANIGASAVYFALNCPNATIVAIEPEPGNFEMLCANVEGLCVRCIQAAIASQPGTTRLVDSGGGGWAYRTDPSGPGIEIPNLIMPQIFERYMEPSDFPFMVKIDIEGGEQDLFESNTDWVEHTAIVVVELHDWLFPRQRTSLPFLRCVSALDRDFVYRGENVFSINNQLLPT